TRGAKIPCRGLRHRRGCAACSGNIGAPDESVGRRTAIRGRGQEPERQQVTTNAEWNAHEDAASWEEFKSSPEAGPAGIQSLLRQLLPFPRLVIEKVSLDERQRLLVEVRPRGRPRCPCCHRKAPIYDHRPSRDWRHLDYGGH